MATKLGRMVTNLERLLPKKLLYPLVTWSSKVTWKTKTIISPPPQCLWLPSLSGWWIALRGSFPCYSTLWSRDLAKSLDKLKPFYSTATVPMATKPGRMVTNLEQLLPIMLLYPFVTWSCEITWLVKTIISPLTKCLWPPNLVGWWLTLSGSFQ